MVMEDWRCLVLNGPESTRREYLNGVVCHDCDAKQGELHDFGCDSEWCPVCMNRTGQEVQALFCTHCYDESGPTDWFKDYPHRIRFWLFLDLVSCFRCGMAYPEIFSVSDQEWERVVPASHRKGQLCRECFDDMKRALDAAKEGG